MKNREKEGFLYWEVEAGGGGTRCVSKYSAWDIMDEFL